MADIDPLALLAKVNAGREVIERDDGQVFVTRDAAVDAIRAAIGAPIGPQAVTMSVLEEETGEIVSVWHYERRPGYPPRPHIGRGG